MPSVYTPSVFLSYINFHIWLHTFYSRPKLWPHPLSSWPSSPFYEFIHSRNCQTNNEFWSLLGSSFLLGAPTSSFSPLLPDWAKTWSIMITSGSHHANTVPVSHLLCGVGVKCRVLSVVVIGLNTQGFTHRNLTEISESFHICENKQFLHS